MRDTVVFEILDEIAGRFTSGRMRKAGSCSEGTAVIILGWYESLIRKWPKRPVSNKRL